MKPLRGRPPRPVPDIAVRVADLRLALEAASARITQALLLLEHPHLAAEADRSPAALLRDALIELDNARH